MSNLINIENVTSCLSAYPLFERVEDIDETCDRVGKVFRPHNLDFFGAGKKLNAHMDHLPMGSITVNRLRYQAEVSISSEPFEKFLLLILPLSDSAEVRCGKQKIFSTHNVAALVDSTTTLAMRWRKDCDQLILRIDREAFERTCSAQLGRPLDHPVEFSLGLDLRSEGGLICENLISLIAANPSFVESILKYPMIAAQVEQSLMSALFISQPNQYRDEILSPSTILTPHYVKRAEEYLLAHASEPFTMRDMATHLGISIRSLYLGFQRYRRMSPKTFLRNVRLDGVHTDIIAARQEKRNETITQIAMSWGFTHLGHFTKAYSAKFNELPSATLRKH
ncbi:AraC family transcriptional regulator [Georgfuchsia toluolica]|uniref:AraC family transcriptional regulator n=1 Tax=Georgfuchsia toluolica TaxID=424218 RepID=A0A916J488_9PROT|nr:AraC family transcriptional regulator [Georgfuchsia toluolica]CAG4883919.1 AraC family transcriptional regulator [Georgfuchsia toluolica]